MTRADKAWLLTTVFLIAALAVGVVVLLIDGSTNPPRELSLSSTTADTLIGHVYIEGAVANPGLYGVTEYDTLESLLSAAGLLPDADVDHVHVTVREHGFGQVPQRININRADPWLLQALPGIGETRAQAIVDYRHHAGAFRRSEDLLNVEGIGRGTLDRIENYISVSD